MASVMGLVKHGISYKHRNMGLVKLATTTVSRLDVPHEVTVVLV